MEKIKIKNSKIINAGKGVFATSDIKKGEVIEVCPIIKLTKNETEIVTKTNLINYLLFFGKRKEKSCVMLGFGSIYNHSKNPNAKFLIKPKKSVVKFIALKNIIEGEEIIFDYKNGQKTNTPLWFEV